MSERNRRLPFLRRPLETARRLLPGSLCKSLRQLAAGRSYPPFHRCAATAAEKHLKWVYTDLANRGAQPEPQPTGRRITTGRNNGRPGATRRKATPSVSRLAPSPGRLADTKRRPSPRNFPYAHSLDDSRGETERRRATHVSAIRSWRGHHPRRRRVYRFRAAPDTANVRSRLISGHPSRPGGPQWPGRCPARERRQMANECGAKRHTATAKRPCTYTSPPRPQTASTPRSLPS
jgi:hypothetical protein